MTTQVTEMAPAVKTKEDFRISMRKALELLAMGGPFNHNCALYLDRSEKDIVCTPEYFTGHMGYEKIGYTPIFPHYTRETVRGDLESIAGGVGMRAAELSGHQMESCVYVKQEECDRDYARYCRMASEQGSFSAQGKIFTTAAMSSMKETIPAFLKLRKNRKASIEMTSHGHTIQIFLERSRQHDVKMETELWSHKLIRLFPERLHGCLYGECKMLMASFLLMVHEMHNGQMANQTATLH